MLLFKMILRCISCIILRSFFKSVALISCHEKPFLWLFLVLVHLTQTNRPCKTVVVHLSLHDKRSTPFHLNSFKLILNLDSTKRKFLNYLNPKKERKTYGMASLKGAILGKWGSWRASDYTSVRKFGRVTPKTKVQLSAGYKSTSVRMKRHSSLAGYNLFFIMILNRLSVFIC